MKMNFKSLSIAVSAFLFVSSSVPVFALEANYNPSERALSVSGSNISSDVAVAVMPYNYSADKLSVDIINSGNSVVFQHITAGGEYNEEILLPVDFPFGKYRVSEISGGVSADTVFFNFSDSAIDKVVSDLNNADKLSDAVSAITALLSGFESDIKSKASDIADFLYKNAPKSGYDSDNFSVSFCLYEGIVSLDNDEITFDTFMEEYSSYMLDDVKEGYDALDADKKSSVAKIVRDMSFKGKSASEISAEITLLSKVKLCTNYDYMKNAVIEYCENNGIDLDAYDDLSEYEKNSVFIEMFGIRNGFKTSDEVIKAFNKHVKNASEDKSSTSGGSSSGGSKGGGSKGAVSGGGYQVGDSTAPVILVEEATKSFDDISSHWAKNEIEKMFSLGIVSGTGNGNFDPDRSVTRAEFVKMLLGALEITNFDTNVTFEDVLSDAWYYKYVSTAVSKGIVNGVSDVSFAPDNTITREDAATMVYRAIKSKISAFSDNDYVDANLISSYATDAVKALSDAQILKGSDGYFRPKTDITRAEAATLLLRIYNLK